MAQIGRNEPCPCGSGKKFKRCCGGIREESFKGGEEQPSDEHILVLAINKNDEVVAYGIGGSAEAEASRRGVTAYVAVVAFGSFRDEAGEFVMPSHLRIIMSDEEEKERARCAYSEFIRDLQEAFAAIREGRSDDTALWTRSLFSNAKLVQDIYAAKDQWRKHIEPVVASIGERLIGGQVQA